MKITKEQEKTLKLEWNKLKVMMKQQGENNKLFLKNNCKNLLKCLKDRWDYKDDDLFDDLLSDVTGNSFKSVLYELRNSGD